MQLDVSKMETGILFPNFQRNKVGSKDTDLFLELLR